MWADSLQLYSYWKCTTCYYDVVRRYFEYKGYEVIYVSNFTDVDDKLINRSKELNESVPEIAEKYIKAFMRTLVL